MTSDDESAAGREAAFREARRLFSVGDDEAVVGFALALAEQTNDPRTAARALVMVLAALLNLGRPEECPAHLDRAFCLLDGVVDHTVRGDLYALAGTIPSPESLDRAVRHLVQSSRELRQVDAPSVEAANAWHNLAVAYSHLGFHGHAEEAADQAYWSAQGAGLARGDHALPETGVRRALSLDHLGDSEGCAAALREVLTTWPERLPISELWSAERLYYDYAHVRLAALGGCQPRAALATTFSDAGTGGFEARDLRLLGGACLAIASGRPQDALARLAGQTVHEFTLGAAEIHRVRALAHVEAGEYKLAMGADRAATRSANQATPLLRSRLVDGANTQLDHVELQRVVAQCVSQAMTDPLTGLPNRRHFDQYVCEAVTRSPTGVVGVIDVDGFKAVNTVHGHLAGDMVLQRLAGILARTIRRGDFVARYGGDEFVLVLTDTDLDAADGLCRRLETAVANGKWGALVPGTPVSVTIGLAPLGNGAHIATALKAADVAMLRRKTVVPDDDRSGAPAYVEG